MVKALNKILVCSLVIPTPESSITIPRVRFSWSMVLRIWTCPFKVYFKALDTRFIMICFKRLPSVIIFGGQILLSLVIIFRSIFLSSALNYKTVILSSNIFKISTSEKFSIRDLDSIYEKSSISFTKKSIRLAQFRAMLQYCIPFSFSIRGYNKPNVDTTPLRGFLNSCAADAKARVFISDKLLVLSSSNQWDISLIVVITSFYWPKGSFIENT